MPAGAAEASAYRSARLGLPADRTQGTALPATLGNWDRPLKQLRQIARAVQHALDAYRVFARQVPIQHEITAVARHFASSSATKLVARMALSRAM
jgi:hypothetical protein